MPGAVRVFNKGKVVPKKGGVVFLSRERKMKRRKNSLACPDFVNPWLNSTFWLMFFFPNVSLIVTGDFVKEDRTGRPLAWQLRCCLSCLCPVWSIWVWVPAPLPVLASC